VTFHVDMVTHARQDLPITIHFARNLPEINFVDLQNVITEGKAVAIFPTLDQVAACDSSGHRALHIEYETSLPSHIGWSDESQRLEGIWPASLAGEFGAERQDGFVMPLGIAAIVTNVFPGDIKLERVARAAVPILVKRRPDICGDNFNELGSPTAHECFDASPLRKLFDRHLLHDLTEAGQAAHGYSFFDQSLPCTPIRVCHARIEHPYFNSLIKQAASGSTATPSHSPRAPPRRREHFCSPLSRTELKHFLQTKANSNLPESPLDLNSLTIASIWDLTAPSDEAREVRCWTIRDTTAKRPRWDFDTPVNMTPAEVTSSPKTPKSPRWFRQAGRAPLLATQLKASPKRETRTWKDPVPVSVSKSPRRKIATSLSCHCDSTALEIPSSPLNGDIGPPFQGQVAATPGHSIEQPVSDRRPRRDSVFDFDAGPELTSLWERDSVSHDELFDIDSTPLPKVDGTSTKRRRNATSSHVQDGGDACEDAEALRLFRLLNWRQEPEKLEDRDVDLLQQEIQMNYDEYFTKTLSETGVAKRMGEEALGQRDTAVSGDTATGEVKEAPADSRRDSAACFAWQPPDTPLCSGSENKDPNLGLSKSPGFLELLRRDDAVEQTERTELKASTDKECERIVAEWEAIWSKRWTVKLDDEEEVGESNLMAFEG
ncbi:hypothetical protein LTR95_017871, partial [Oleoguttula sp. CCFEE 5521]